MTVPDQKMSELDQATPFIDACIEHGVAHLVFASGDRGGAVSDVTPTTVPNLQSKFYIEKYLKEKSAAAASSKRGSCMQWTIFRPTSFMENLSKDMHGAGFARLWSGLGSKPLQLVSTRDIGRFAAVALLDPEEYVGREIGVAGDELTFEEARRIFREEVGTEIKVAPCLVGKALKMLVGDLGEMFSWLETDGFGAEVHIALGDVKTRDFRTWLRESSDWKKQ